MCDGLGNIECLYTLNTDVEVERCFRYLDQEVRSPLWSCLEPVTNVNSKYDFMIVTVQFLSDLKVILWCDLIMTAGTMIQLEVQISSIFYNSTIQHSGRAEPKL